MKDKRSRPVFSKIITKKKIELSKIKPLKKKFKALKMKESKLKLNLKVWDIVFGYGKVYHINDWHCEYSVGVVFKNDNKVFYSVSGYSELSEDISLFRIKKR